ncbi:MAG: FAD-binding oxidoreductase [Longimicrobiales bacterium]
MGVPGSEFRVPSCVQPVTIEEAATAIREHAEVGRALRPRGGGTKLGWLAQDSRSAASGGREANGLAVGVIGAETGNLPSGTNSEPGTEGGRADRGRRRGRVAPGGEPTRNPELGAAADRGGAVELDTRGLNRVLEHNEGDFTAVLEAGVRLADAQAMFGRAGQMLALDPPLGEGDAATIGGVIAAADSGPLRHRYGSVRELVLGVTVVLSDGTVAKSGGKVIKNVAGYDLAKLFAGSYGTLGVIARVAIRLHPLASATATAQGASADPDRLAATALALARLPLEADALDVSWSNGAGRVLVRFSGAAAAERARAAAARMDVLEGIETITTDDELWARQRALQRAPRDIVLKVSGRATDLARVLRAAEAAGGTAVSRAALGLSWIALPAASGVDAIRRALAPRACTVLDGADRVTEPWPEIEPSTLTLMKRVKDRFDPAGAFHTGSFVGRI